MIDLTQVRLRWRKSTRSGQSQGACVEIATDLVDGTDLPEGKAAIRDSKNPYAGAHRITRSSFEAFIDGVKAGRFDL